MPSRSRRTTTLAAALLAVCLLGGCSDSEPSPTPLRQPAATVDDISAPDGPLCPRRLPQGDDPEDRGFGTAERARSAPTLPVPDVAWICRYDPDDVGAGPDGTGYTWGWVRAGEIRLVRPTRLPELAFTLTGLSPLRAGQGCTDDLGPRWMLVTSHESDLTGVVVDDFGCQDVRLTDDPFETAPGEATRAGIVPGVLAGPPGLLDELLGLPTCPATELAPGPPC